MIEARVVRHQHRITKKVAKRGYHSLDGRGIRHHLVSDRSEPADKSWNRTAGTDQRVERVYHSLTLHAICADLDDPVRPGPSAGRFKVNHAETHFAERHAEHAAFAQRPQIRVRIEQKVRVAAYKTADKSLAEFGIGSGSGK